MTTAAETRTCANCGARLHGRFCAICGQEDRPLQPSTKELLSDTLETLLDVDGRIFRSLHKLFFVPGFLTVEHFAGRRAAWVSPLRLYLLISVIYFAVSALTGETNVSVQVDGGDVQGELRELGFESEADLERAVQEAEARWRPRTMFLLVPLFAGLTQMVQPRSGRNYPQHLVFTLHVHGAWFAALTLDRLAGWAVDVGWVEFAASALVLVYAIGYLVLAMRRVYGGTLPRSLARAVLVGLLYWLATIVTVAAIVVGPIFLA